ncbi:phosphatase PAP2 family protein [Deminuibacter soli]|uniref:Phosphatase PAP2 family protein n=1 Tax=Deminuibacter soli TaxID=2291815 RepID=A0A3E1NDU6_9BACT|nr:phosphatase PAP2 family protein [Deminuibacter soli]RFM26139.1 phosphatase PAP2 family protein [Deminuibacter soli]
MQHLNIAAFKKGIQLTAMLAMFTLSASAILGKNECFLWLNTNLGIVADYFFAAWTYMGDGLVWIAVLLVLLFVLKKKQFLPMAIAAFLLSTAFTQIGKHWIRPGEARPIRAIHETNLIHTVPFVEVHTISSFPSGHTGTAFTIYLFLCLLIPGTWWVAVGFLYAILVAYSRIYLAQHFPLDAGAGMVIGILSASLAMIIQQRFTKKSTVVSGE